jgi:hypothetical protein
VAAVGAADPALGPALVVSATSSGIPCIVGSSVTASNYERIEAEHSTNIQRPYLGCYR